MTDRIGFGRTVQLSFDQAIDRVTEELRNEGFGVLTQIDVAATLKSKLGVEGPPYRILGACNPQLAHRALQIDPQVGLLLPCNVVVREDQGAVRVEFMDPDAVLALTDQPGVREVAAQAKERLLRVCAAL
jgi:uncharacterized protein (DUF302 family)